MVGVEEMTDFRDSGQFSRVRCGSLSEFGILATELPTETLEIRDS